MEALSQNVSIPLGSTPRHSTNQSFRDLSAVTNSLNHGTAIHRYLLHPPSGQIIGPEREIHVRHDYGLEKIFGMIQSKKYQTKGSTFCH
jgi:hypothetical protein